MSAVWIREATRSDRRAIGFAFNHLGPRSRHQRFFGGKMYPRPSDVARMATPDHWHREVLIAWSRAPRAPVGVAEYVRLQAFDAAEVAVAVVDEWQRRGVGLALVCDLRDRAFGAGIRHFAVCMFRDNRGARALAQPNPAGISAATDEAKWPGGDIVPA